MRPKRQWRRNSCFPDNRHLFVFLLKDGNLVLNQAKKRRVFPRLGVMICKTYAVMTNPSETGTKKCSTCQGVKLFSDFYGDKHKARGLSSRCKDCAKQAAMEWRRQNPQKVRENQQKNYQRNKDQYVEYAKQWRENNTDRIRQYYQENKEAIKEKRKGKSNLLREMFRGAKHRASDNCLPFDLTIEHMESIALDHCPVTGELLDWDLQFSQEGKRNPHAPSLDKIVPSLGYVQGNVAIISNRMNTLKSDMTLEQLNQLIEYVQRNT